MPRPPGPPTTSSTERPLRSPRQRQADLLQQGRVLRAELGQSVAQTWTDTLDRQRTSLKWLGLGLKQGQALRRWWSGADPREGAPPSGAAAAGVSVGLAALVWWFQRGRRRKTAPVTAAATVAAKPSTLGGAVRTLRRVRRALWWWQVGAQLWRWINEVPPPAPTHPRPPDAGKDPARADPRATR